MSLHIRNEDEFQHHVTEWKYHPISIAHEFYPRVRRIGGESVSPDIDLLTIMDCHDDRKLVCAYEFKFLKHRNIEANYSRINEGIGEALSYFRYGVDASYLVVGLSSLVSHAKAKIIEKLEYYSKILGELDYFGILVWFENKDDGLHCIKAPIKEASFAVRFPEIDLHRRNLLAKKISYDWKFGFLYANFQYLHLKITRLEYARDKISLHLENVGEGVAIKGVAINKKQFVVDVPLDEDEKQIVRIDYIWRPSEILDIFVRTSNNEVTPIRRVAPAFAMTENTEAIDDCSE